MGKSRTGRPDSLSASRTIWTWSANFAVGVEPAPKKPLPSRTARRRAVGADPPTQTGGEGVWEGLGAPGAVGRGPEHPPEGEGGRPAPAPHGARPPREPAPAPRRGGPEGGGGRPRAAW